MSRDNAAAGSDDDHVEAVRPAIDHVAVATRPLVPADRNSLAFARTPEQVLAIVFDGGATSGGFFPNGVAGTFASSMS